MSRYLSRRIEENPAITLRTHTEIVGLDGGHHLERVTWRNNVTGETKTCAVAHVFVMAGAVPNTHWLDGCVALDDKGFIKTGAELDSATISPPRSGRSPDGRSSSKPACRACSPLATSAAVT